jgi:RND family efflux transporter MFP subunit
MTIRNKILPALALLGLAVAAVVAVRQQRATPPAQPVAQPSRAPFAAYIGGSGMIEAGSDNVEVGAPAGGVVREVAVKVGQKVGRGDLLFSIDDRDARAAVALKEASLLKARAALEQSRANWRDYRTQYERMRGVTDLRAVSLDDLEKRRNAELLARAEVKSAEADVAVAQAELDAARTALDLLTVRSPLDGEVLQVNIRPGEYAATGVLDTPLLLLGSMDDLHVRVDIDENDAWRFVPGARAVAYLRGNRDLGAELAFVRVEPYVRPKTSLSGSSTEQVDTRVLQVIYSFKRADLPAAYAGQQVDAFIEAAPTASSLTARAAAPAGGEAR